MLVVSPNLLSLITKKHKKQPICFFNRLDPNAPRNDAKMLEETVFI